MHNSIAGAAVKFKLVGESGRKGDCRPRAGPPGGEKTAAISRQFTPNGHGPPVCQVGLAKLR
jgi:hypothetical protein